MKNWKNVKQILGEALELDISERLEFLKTVNMSDATRLEVESLLGFEGEAEHLMKLSALEFSSDLFDQEDPSMIGQTLGNYRVVRELGYGGMGAVFLAERIDGKFQQRVALKLLKREMNTSALRRRFQQEREILASLDHPNIARLIDAGTTADRIPYIAMEYVKGIAIDEYCNKHKLGLTARLDLFREVCRVVDFAHRNLVVHRDLKPSNILVTEEGTPKLLDFGISKIISDGPVASATVTKMGAMTPTYASPEQLKSKSVTTATDVFSLGVILFELLTGHRPFESREDNLNDIYRAVIEKDPPLPSEVVKTTTLTVLPVNEVKTKRLDMANSKHETDVSDGKPQTVPDESLVTQPEGIQINPQRLRGDLDNIVLKALKKAPEKRYSSPENLAEDIRKYQSGLPVTARPDTFFYRAEKFVKRNTLSVGAAALVLLAMIGGVISTLWQARVAQAERVKAESRFNDVRKLANSFLFEFSPMIENLPGSTPARELLVKRALEYLDSLSRESTNDPDLLRELAAAYEKVGDVQGNPYKPNIGEVKGALKSYERSMTIREGLLQNAPKNTELQSDLAQNYLVIGELHSNGGDYAKATPFLDKSLAIREKLLKSDPSDFDRRLNLAKIVKSRGSIPFFNGENKKAIEYYERAKSIYEKLNEEKPNDDSVAKDYAYLFILIGDAQGWDNDIKNAHVSLNTGLQRLIPIAAKHPSDQSFQRILMLAYSKSASGFEGTEENDRSVALWEKSVEIAENILKNDSRNFIAKRDVALTTRRLAQSLDSVGKSKLSLEKMLFALKLFKELRKSDPNNSEIAYDIPNSEFAIGETYLGLKDYNSALRTLFEAKSGMESVLKINPKNIYAARGLGFITDRIGKAYSALSQGVDREGNLRLALKFQIDGLAKLKLLKSEGNLSEFDNEELEMIEKEIEYTSKKLSS